MGAREAHTHGTDIQIQEVQTASPRCLRPDRSQRLAISTWVRLKSPCQHDNLGTHTDVYVSVVSVVPKEKGAEVPSCGGGSWSPRSKRKHRKARRGPQSPYRRVAVVKWGSIGVEAEPESHEAVIDLVAGRDFEHEFVIDKVIQGPIDAARRSQAMLLDEILAIDGRHSLL